MLSGPRLPLLFYLQEVCRQLLVSVAIIEGQSCGETGHGDAMLDSSADCSAPRLLNKEIKRVNYFIKFLFVLITLTLISFGGGGGVSGHEHENLTRSLSS